MGQYLKAARSADVASGKLRSIELAGRRIALFSIGGQIYAIGDLAAHKQPLESRITQTESLASVLQLGFTETPSNDSPDARATAPADLTDPQLPQADTIIRYNVRIAGDDVEIEI